MREKNKILKKIILKTNYQLKLRLYELQEKLRVNFSMTTVDVN